MIHWPENLVRDLARRRCVIVIGSGVSANSQTPEGTRPPTWGTFLNNAHDRLGRPRRVIQSALKRFEYLEACAYLKRELGENAWREMVRDVFLTPHYAPADIHAAILDVDPRIVVSLNFDRIYERYVHSRDQQTFIVKKYNDGDIRQVLSGTDRYVLKPHGSAEDLPSMIFTLEDYARARIQNYHFYRMLEALMATHTFLFLGCGLSDPDLRLLFEDHRFTFDEAPHFMTLSKPVASETSLLISSTRGINILGYSSANDHQELTESLQRLSSQVAEMRDEIAVSRNW